jgi:hypothetical protein
MPPKLDELPMIAAMLTPGMLVGEKSHSAPFVVARYKMVLEELERQFAPNPPPTKSDEPAIDFRELGRRLG